MASNFTYKGIGADFNMGETGIPQAKTDIELAADNLEQAIFTQLGERVMQPEFGSRIYEIVFENDTEFMHAEIASEIIRVAKRWCPRVSVEASDISVEVKEEEVIITVGFTYMKETAQVQKSIPTSK